MLWTSLVAQRVKRLPAMQETQIRSLGQEDPLEREMVTKSRTRLSDVTSPDTGHSTLLHT